MEIDLLNSENIKKLLDSMDKDCATRLALSALSGRKKFLKQLNIEATVQGMREDLRNQETIEKQP